MGEEGMEKEEEEEEGLRKKLSKTACNRDWWGEYGRGVGVGLGVGVGVGGGGGFEIEVVWDCFPVTEVRELESIEDKPLV